MSGEGKVIDLRSPGARIDMTGPARRDKKQLNALVDDFPR
jgi:hypothetical protein